MPYSAHYLTNSCFHSVSSETCAVADADCTVASGLLRWCLLISHVGGRVSLDLLLVFFELLDLPSKNLNFSSHSSFSYLNLMVCSLCLNVLAQKCSFGSMATCWSWAADSSYWPTSNWTHWETPGSIGCAGGCTLFAPWRGTERLNYIQIDHWITCHFGVIDEVAPPRCRHCFADHWNWWHSVLRRRRLSCQMTWYVSCWVW